MVFNIVKMHHIMLLAMHIDCMQVLMDFLFHLWKEEDQQDEDR